MLREELTRYQFFLQLKNDIKSGRLECPYETLVQLAACVLQCESLFDKPICSYQFPNID